jgi:hypothetical protein
MLKSELHCGLNSLFICFVGWLVGSFICLFVRRYLGSTNKVEVIWKISNFNGGGTPSVHYLRLKEAPK